MKERAAPSAMVGVWRSTKSHLSGGLVAGPQDVLAGRAERSARRSGRGPSETCCVHGRFVGWTVARKGQPNAGSQAVAMKVKARAVDGRLLRTRRPSPAPWPSLPGFPVHREDNKVDLR